MGYPATQVTEVSLDADRLILNGATIRVAYIFCSNDSGASVTVQVTDNQSSPQNKFTVPLQPGEKFPLDFSWIADKGVRIASVGSADVKVTVGHGAEGA